MLRGHESVTLNRAFPVPLTLEFPAVRYPLHCLLCVFLRYQLGYCYHPFAFPPAFPRAFCHKFKLYCLSNHCGLSLTAVLVSCLPWSVNPALLHCAFSPPPALPTHFVPRFLMADTVSALCLPTGIPLRVRS